MAAKDRSINAEMLIEKFYYMSVCQYITVNKSLDKTFGMPFIKRLGSTARIRNVIDS